MICPRCNQDSPTLIGYCYNCGENLIKVEKNQIIDASNGWIWLGVFNWFVGLLLWLVLKIKYPYISKKSKKGFIIGIILFSIIMLIALIALIILYIITPSIFNNMS